MRVRREVEGNAYGRRLEVSRVRTIAARDCIIASGAVHKPIVTSATCQTVTADVPNINTTAYANEIDTAKIGWKDKGGKCRHYDIRTTLGASAITSPVDTLSQLS